LGFGLGLAGGSDLGVRFGVGFGGSGLGPLGPLGLLDLNIRLRLLIDCYSLYKVFIIG